MIEFRGVSRAFNGKTAVKDLSLQVAEGEFCVLLGTSGSGKSTTLKMINRLVEFDSGDIRFAGESIRQLNARTLRRRMGYAIQSIGLFPHWTVQKNIATVPELLGWPRAQINERITALLALLNLDAQLLKRYPHQLSGGQQHLRIGGQRSRHADPLLLPAGELMRIAIQQLRVKVEQRQQRRDALIDLRSGPAQQHRHRGDVLPHRPVRKKANRLNGIAHASA